MRLVARTVYRAFPELDRYSDEQCLRFVRSARGGWVRRGLGAATLLLVFVALLAGGVLAAVWATDYDHGRFDPLRQGSWRALVGLAAMLIAVAPAPLGLYLARDWMLRRRVRFVLRSRGVCRSCWYSLVGLAVDEKSRVRCPECGEETEVDASLGELTTDDGGRVRFKPDADHLDLSRRFWTPARQKKARRVFVWTMAGALLGLIIIVGGWETFIRLQAREARAARVGAAGLMAYVKQHQPPGSEAAANGWDALKRAIEIMDRADEAVWRGHAQTSALGEAILPRFELVAGTVTAGRRPRPQTDVEALRAGKELAERMLQVYSDAGLGDALTELAASAGVVRPIELNAEDPLMGLALPELGAARQLGRACAAEMAEARRKRDRERFVRALEAELALARAVRSQPLLIDGRFADAMEAMALDGVAACLRGHPSTAWLESIEGAIERQGVNVPNEYHLNGDRLCGRDTIAWMFSDPGRVRFGRFSPAMKNMWGGTGGAAVPLGTFRQNLRAYDQMIDATIEQIGVDPWKRIPLASSPAPPAQPLLMRMLAPAMQHIVHARDDRELRRRGLRVMLALERFRAATGAYPATLEELTPAYVKQLPEDIWSGRPLKYKRLGTTESGGREYLLYSIGPNRTDDGGVDGVLLQGTVVFRPGDPLPADDLILNKAEDETTE